MENPRSLCFRQMCFNGLVHHTGRLAVYLRHEIPVPALYGPSADEQWSPPQSEPSSGKVGCSLGAALAGFIIDADAVCDHQALFTNLRAPKRGKGSKF